MKLNENKGGIGRKKKSKRVELIEQNLYKISVYLRKKK